MLNLFDPKLTGYGQSCTGRYTGRVKVNLEFSFPISIFSALRPVTFSGFKPDFFHSHTVFHSQQV